MNRQNDSESGLSRPRYSLMKMADKYIVMSDSWLKRAIINQLKKMGPE